MNELFSTSALQVVSLAFAVLKQLGELIAPAWRKLGRCLGRNTEAENEPNPADDLDKQIDQIVDLIADETKLRLLESYEANHET